MATFSEYTQYDALGLAELVRNGAVSAEDLLETAIELVEQRNPRVNAVNYKMYDLARQSIAAGLPDGPFTGVPFLLKDLVSTYAGVPTGSGNRLLKDIPMPVDSELVKRFKQSGVVIFGKTNSPEFGLTPYTEPDTYGPTLNPWDTTRTPGGSSGGTGAAVALHMVPMASGGDGGGSIRIPSSCCGVFGMKPTRGRLPTGPAMAENWEGFATEHVLTRSVRDSAAMLDATVGHKVGEWYQTQLPEQPFLDAMQAPVGKLRIAYCEEPLLRPGLEPDCRAGLEHTKQLLRDLGHELIPIEIPMDIKRFSMEFVRVLIGQTWADIAQTAAFAGKAPSRHDFEPVTFGLGTLGKHLSAADYVSSVRYLQENARRVQEILADYDVFLSATLSRLPVKIGELKPTPLELFGVKTLAALNLGRAAHAFGLVESISEKVFQFIPDTPMFNATGQPAMSVPLYWNADNIPVGMQFAARFGDDATLFKLAKQLEDAQPWFDRTPPL